MTPNEATSTRSDERCRKMNYMKTIDLLAYTVKEEVYGPVDRMARALSLDSVKMALYEAIRYATSGKERERENLDVEGLYEEIDCFLSEFKPGLAKDIALKALAKGLAQRGRAKAQAGEAKEAEKTQRS